MRFAQYEHGKTSRAGVVAGHLLHPLPEDTSVTDLVRAGLPEALRRGEAALGQSPVPITEVRLLPPVQPAAVRDFLTFEEHVAALHGSRGLAVPPEWYEAPTFYFTNPANLHGAADEVPVPPGCALFDFELEVAAVVGAVPGVRAASLDPVAAREHIFGYAIYNDWSARDLQWREMVVGLGPAKGKDSAATLGPWLVTADELDAHRDDDGFFELDLRVAVNGVELGHDRLSNMAWRFEDLLAYASRGTLLQPGDVLASGTCGNGGCLAELWARSGSRSDPPPLRPGDVVEMAVEGIGALRNTVVAGSAAPAPVPAARRRVFAEARS